MRIAVGYVPLIDAAPVIAAAELGFARAEGLDLALSCEPSWATLRDRLALGHLDAAHMLAPLAIASALGLSGPPANLIVPMALNLNGNAVTVSNALWAGMAPASDGIADVAHAFGRIARARADGGAPLTIGTVHPFSSHSYQLRLFAGLGDFDLDRTVRLVVVPPPDTVDALERGLIDGFCVGAPWNSIAVAAGLGRVAALGCEIAPDCPEKVLALPENADFTAPLVRAVHRAGSWCADPENREALCALLAGRAEFGVDPALIARTLSGALIVDSAGTVRRNPAYLRLGATAHCPQPTQLHWFLERMVACGQIVPGSGEAERAAGLYRPDLFLTAIGG